MASTYLTRTFGSGNRKKFTLSMWVKLSGRGTGNNNALLVCGSSGGNEATISFGSDNLTWTEYTPGGGSVAYLSTSKLFRDYSAWYHLVFVWDTANATANDRMKIYVNGVQETSFGGRTNPTLNYDATLNTNIVHEIGRQTWNSSGLFNGSMSHIHFIDGTTYDATAFGEYDANGVWKIKTSPSVTYGTNGFFILKDGNSVTDQSGNSNNFTVGGGTLTKTEDSPSNVFATFNGAFNLSDIVLLRGNASATSSGASWKYVPTTLGASSGKFYAEYLCGGSANTFMHGVVDMEYAVSQDQNSYTQLGNGTGGMGYYSGGESYTTGTATSYGDSYAVGDYIGIALDMDNNKVYFSKNGVWQNSGDPTSGATGTGALSLPTTGTYAFGTSVKDSSKTDANFGNGFFGTTPVSSAGTNASGNGIFEYDVPTGYTALSTKGLNL